MTLGRETLLHVSHRITKRRSFLLKPSGLLGGLLCLFVTEKK